MSLRTWAEQYLAMRRGLGFKLRQDGRLLLDFAAQGLSNEAIAERLFISRHTVNAHLSHIRITTGAAVRSSR